MNSGTPGGGHLVQHAFRRLSIALQTITEKVSKGTSDDGHQSKHDPTTTGLGLNKQMAHGCGQSNTHLVPPQAPSEGNSIPVDSQGRPCGFDALYLFSGSVFFVFGYSSHQVRGPKGNPRRATPVPYNHRARLKAPTLDKYLCGAG